MPEGIVSQIGLQFRIYRHLTQEEAREILICSAERFASSVNSSVKIKPFLKIYPFTINNIDISLFIADSQGRDTFHPDIGIASIVNGELTYVTFQKTETLRRESEWSESYEDAVKLLRKSENKNDK